MSQDFEDDVGKLNTSNSFLLPASENLQHNYQLGISQKVDPSLRTREMKAHFCDKKLFFKEKRAKSHPIPNASLLQDPLEISTMMFKANFNH